jgi:hypothetical protein
MRKHPSGSRKLHLAKETIRTMLAPELRAVAGGISCGAGTACDCSGNGDQFTLANCGSEGCTRPQY